jgi:uncharacterized protein (DUF488 family)
MSAETPWWKCHRRLIAELLTARGVVVTHLLGPGRRESHRLYDESEIREGSSTSATTWWRRKLQPGKTFN